MSKKIVTFEHNGDFPAVGMNHRYSTTLKRPSAIKREAERSCHAKPNRRYQVTDFHTDLIIFEATT